MSAAPTTRALLDWIVKRGVLYGLTQAPMIALVVGYFWRWTDFATATAFTVIPAYILLPIWIMIRKSRSDDPQEPAHHFHRYALYALLPYVIYNLSRMPMHYLLGIVFWDHWYDFGAALTGRPVDQWSSLLPGTLLHSLQGYVLALGFYVLYKRHSLLNSLIYVWVFLSMIYSWAYPTFVLVDFQPPAKWFFVVWWAHFWMALAVWLVPKSSYSMAFWGKMRNGLAKATLIILIVGIYFLPVEFVFWRVPTWQFPLQRTIDQAAFDRVNLSQQGEPILASLEAVAGQTSEHEARYRFTLRFGPRIYKDYINASKALDAGPIRIEGHLIHKGDIIAWCARDLEQLETPNKIIDPRDYFPALERMAFTEIEVPCVGPTDAVNRLAGGAEVSLRWVAEVRLVGDRGQMDRVFEGTSKVASLQNRALEVTSKVASLQNRAFEGTSKAASLQIGTKRVYEPAQEETGPRRRRSRGSLAAAAGNLWQRSRIVVPSRARHGESWRSSWEAVLRQERMVKTGPIVSSEQKDEEQQE